MAGRAEEIADFLASVGWKTSRRQAFDADFSPRRYARLTKADGTTAILMDADAAQNTPAFVALGALLHATGVRAPEIYAANPIKGLVLMEDFGAYNVGVLLDRGADPVPYFKKAVLILAHLHKNLDMPALQACAVPKCDTPFLIQKASQFVDFYLPYARGRTATPEERAGFSAAWESVLRPLESLPQTLCLRDFMADNLMELADGSLGVLDFQDGGIGCIAYDLASLCEEVRRDGGFKRLSDCITLYRTTTGTPLSEKELLRACTIFSAQRHTRILGLLASRMSDTTAHRDTQGFLPRTRAHWLKLLENPALDPVRAWVTQAGVL